MDDSYGAGGDYHDSFCVVAADVPFPFQGKGCKDRHQFR